MSIRNTFARLSQPSVTPDTTLTHRIVNRTVTLRDELAKIEKGKSS